MFSVNSMKLRFPERPGAGAANVRRPKVRGNTLPGFPGFPGFAVFKAFLAPTTKRDVEENEEDYLASDMEEAHSLQLRILGSGEIKQEHIEEDIHAVGSFATASGRVPTRKLDGTLRAIHVQAAPSIMYIYIDHSISVKLRTIFEKTSRKRAL